jgi:hypothetical protein
MKHVIIIAAALALAGCVGTMPEPYDAVADLKNDPPPPPVHEKLPTIFESTKSIALELWLYALASYRYLHNSTRQHVTRLSAWARQVEENKKRASGANRSEPR